MKNLLYCFLLMTIYGTSLNAQSVGIGTSAPKPSSLLDITSTSKGVLLPRLTTAQRLAIANPERALLVFDTDKGSLMMFDGIQWKVLSLDDADKSVLANRNAGKVSAEARFGQAVDIAGNYAIVGAPFYVSPVLGNKVGEAYIFYKDASGWKSQARIAAPDSASFDFFGTSVAIIGDYCVVGCPQKLVDGNYSQGKAYVYKRNGTTWVFDAALTYPGVASGQFGYSVDISLNSANQPVIAVGAPGYATGGEVFTYKRTGNSWALLQAIAPNDLTTGNNFGLSVSLSQDYLAAGAPDQDNTSYSATDAGAVYIFVYGGGVFTQQQKLQGYYKNAEFGYSLSLYGNKLVVAAPWAPAYGYADGTGYVVVIKRTGAVWEYTYTQFSIPTQDGGSFNMRYGITLSISDDQLLIGAPSGIIFPAGGSIGGAVAGSAYLYYTPDDGVNYYLKQKLLAANSASADLFGHAVAIEPGGNYVVGIPYQNAATSYGFFTNAGGVYFGF
jgi:hypothetical protein